MSKKQKHHKNKKSPSNRDPHLQREEQKYGEAVPSREFIISELDSAGRPLNYTTLFERLHCVESQHEGMRRRLKAMQRDGQLICNRRGDYALVDSLELVRGRIIAHRDGFGFLVRDDDKADIFLPARQMRGVFAGDIVLVRVTQSRGSKTEGAIAEILERKTQQVVGRFYEEGAMSFVAPSSTLTNQDIIVSEKNRNGAEHGQYVSVELIEQPNFRRQPIGRVVSVLGDHLTPGMEVMLSIQTHDIPDVWPAEVTEQASYFNTSVDEKDKLGREDCRALPFVTIDGEDAKDFDDAVYCERMSGGGWRVMVAIADVAHYVKPQSALDIEARNRGNSVYFPSKVIPMLPEALSNGLCSLNPKVDRLAMVCDMQVDEAGICVDATFYNAVIHSHARLTYTQVADMLYGSGGADKSVIWPQVRELHRVYKKLLKQRVMRGAIDFDTTETRIVFDDDGKIGCIVPVKRNDAHKLIEEFMLLTNQMAAKKTLAEGIPMLYRNHEPPGDDKLLGLRDYLKVLGLRLTGGDTPTSQDYASLISRIQGREDQHILQMVLLQSLKQAKFSPKNSGHFGLAYEEYAQFTSPIRRYPDLVLHRAIKHLCAGKSPQSFSVKGEDMQALGDHCSMTDRRADVATRDAVNWLKCHYMKDKIGDEFEGVISSVTGFGLFVELNHIYVEGLIHISALQNDYYHFDDVQRRLIGKHSGVNYHLGKTLKVRIVRVDLDERKIDFELLE